MYKNITLHAAWGCPKAVGGEGEVSERGSGGEDVGKNVRVLLVMNK